MSLIFHTQTSEGWYLSVPLLLRASGGMCIVEAGGAGQVGSGKQGARYLCHSESQLK